MLGAVLLHENTHKISTEGLSLDMEQRATKAKLCAAHAVDDSALLTSEVTNQKYEALCSCSVQCHWTYTRTK